MKSIKQRNNWILILIVLLPWIMGIGGAYVSQDVCTDGQWLQWDATNNKYTCVSAPSPGVGSIDRTEIDEANIAEYLSADCSAETGYDGRPCIDNSTYKKYVYSAGAWHEVGCATDYTDAKANGTLLHADPTVQDITGAGVSGSNPVGTEVQYVIKGNYVLYQNWTDTQVTGTTSPTTVASYILPAGTLSSTDGLRIKVGATVATQGATYSYYRIFFGGVKIAERSRSNAKDIFLEAEVYNTGATNSQEYFDSSTSYASVVLGTATVDTSQDVTIEVKIDPGTTSDDWTHRFLVIEYLDN